MAQAKGGGERAEAARIQGRVSENDGQQTGSLFRLNGLAGEFSVKCVVFPGACEYHKTRTPHVLVQIKRLGLCTVAVLCASLGAGAGIDMGADL